MTRETADLRAALCANQQQLTPMMRGQTNTPPIVAWPTVFPMTPTLVMYATPPPTYRPQT